MSLFVFVYFKHLTDAVCTCGEYSKAPVHKEIVILKHSLPSQFVTERF